MALDDDSWGYGLYAKGGSYTLDDPDGEVEDTFSTHWGGKVTFYPQRRGRRAFLAVETGSFTLDADRSGLVNNEVSMIAARLGYEMRYNLSRDFKIWFGGTINGANIESENRFTLASDGFLDENLRSRDHSAVGFTVFADTYFELTEQGDIQLGVGPFYERYANNGVEAFGLKITLERQ